MNYLNNHVLVLPLYADLEQEDIKEIAATILRRLGILEDTTFTVGNIIETDYLSGKNQISMED